MHKADRAGPHITASCHGCKYHRQERYDVQGDRGYDHYCDGSGGRAIPEYPGCPTPDWCAYMTEEQRKVLGNLHLYDDED